MNNPMDLHNKTILITGASSGIGREAAILLSQLGASLILVGRNVAELERTLSMLNGSDHTYEIMDLAKAVDDIPEWMKDLVRKKCALNGLVHCAGAQFIRPLRITTGVCMEELMRINVTTALTLAKGFRHRGVSSPKSSIVFITSVMGLVGQAGQGAYAASKGALISLTKSLALELAREDIRVNCIAPGIVKTEMSDRMFEGLLPEQVEKIKLMHPLGIGSPRDIAYAIAFLLADSSRWITGTTLVVDGGYTAS